MARPRPIVTPNRDPKILVPRSLLERAADAIAAASSGTEVFGFGSDGKLITVAEFTDAIEADIRHYIKRAR